MSASQPLMLVLDADLPVTERQQYEIRGARFGFLSQIVVSTDIPLSVAILVVPKAEDQAASVTRIVRLAKRRKRGISVRSYNGLVNLRKDILSTLPAYVPRATAKNSNCHKTADREVDEKPSVQVDAFEVEISRLRGQLATALEEKERLSEQLDRIIRKEQLKSLGKDLQWQTEVQRLKAAVVRLTHEVQEQRTGTDEDSRDWMDATEHIVWLQKEAERILSIHETRMQFVDTEVRLRLVIQKYESDWKEVIQAFLSLYR